jgi:hypothetical protein
VRTASTVSLGLKALSERGELTSPQLRSACRAVIAATVGDARTTIAQQASGTLEVESSRVGRCSAAPTGSAGDQTQYDHPANALRATAMRLEVPVVEPERQDGVEAELRTIQARLN